MTEPRPIWIAGYQPPKEPPNTVLNPPSGGSGVFNPLIINGEPLSTKQLHELITSQAMTIDRLYGEVGWYRAALKEIAEYPFNNFYLDCGVRVIAEKALKK